MFDLPKGLWMLIAGVIGAAIAVVLCWPETKYWKTDDSGTRREVQSPPP